ncbi:MAG: TIM barrel protein, partial [Planctomycetes bacterium]|nr:TIM barrel protein [Planctomycetota bacterium]
MSKIRGPGIFLAQFLRDIPPYNSIDNIGKWFASLGYKGVQIPSWDGRVFNLDQAASSQAYCDDYRAKLHSMGLEITEITGYLQGQMIAVHPAYEVLFEGFHPKGLTGNARTEWAVSELKKCVLASQRFGLRNVPVLSGGFAWHLVYPWPQRPPGLIDQAFTELSQRWRPLLDFAQDHGCVFGYELHPGSDLFDGATFEMF